MNHGFFSQALHCVTCNKNVDAWSDATDHGNSPKHGDITICMYCSEVMQFDFSNKDVGLIKASEDVLMELAGDPEFVRVMTAASAIRKARFTH